MFQYYIKTWTYLDIDDETDEIYTEENLLEEWVQRPEKPYKRPPKSKAG